MRMHVSLFANLIGQGWTAVLNLAAVPFYIHMLGVDSFGLIGLFTVVLTVVSLFDAGMTTTLNREMVRFIAGERSVDSTRDLMRSVEIGLGAAGLLLILAAMAAGPLLADVWIGRSTIPASVVSASLTMMIVASVLRVIEAIYRAALLGLHRPVLMNALSVVFSTLRIAGVFGAFALVAADLRTFFIWQVAIGLLTLTGYIAATYWAIGRGSRRARFDMTLLREIGGFAGGAFAISALGIVLTQADKLLVPRLVSLREVGYYSAAVVIATGIYQLVLPIFHSFYPRFSFLHATGKKSGFETTYLRAARLIAVVAGCPIAVFMSFGHEILFAWTGNAEVAEAAAPLLTRMGPGVLAYGLYHLPLAAFLATGAQRVAVRTTGVAVLLLVPAILAGFELAGLEGVVAGWSMVLCFALILSLVAIRRSVLPRTPMMRMLSAFFVPVAVAFAVSGLLRLLPVAQANGRAALVANLILVGLAVLSLTALATWSGGITARVRRWSKSA